MAWLQSQSLWVQEFAEGLAVLQFDPPGKTTRLTRHVIDELDAAIAAVEKESRFKAIIIRSLKPGRFAQGLDVPGWKTLQAEGGVEDWCRRGQSLWNRLYGLKIPTMAWVSGACLGAGLELALACDQIFVVDQLATSLGFSELDLGLIPSWGGYGPLVRRIGLQNAFPLAFAGRRLTAREGAAAGLADHLSPSDEPDFTMLAQMARKRDPHLWTRRTWRQHLFERFARGRRVLYRGVERLQARRIPDGLLAPGVALGVMKSFIERGIAEGQSHAQSALVELAKSRAFDNLVRLHELREHAAVSPSKLGFTPRKQTVGIVGATSAAMHLLVEVVRREGSVVLRESDETKLGVSILKLVQSMSREIQSGKMTPQQSQKSLSRIRSTVTWKNFDEADWVIDFRDRTDVLAELDENVDAKTPIVLVSSAGRLDAAVHGTKHPERFLGTAFPEPIGMFPIAEWRRTTATHESAPRKLREWLGGLGWLPIEVGDAPGLLLSRLWIPAWNEMVILLREGVGLELIDRALIRFGFGRGPLEYLDGVGMDQVERWIDIVREEVTPRVPVDSFWEQVVGRGWRGQASGKGFYRHGRAGIQPNHLLVNWLRGEGPIDGRTLPAMSKKDQEHVICERVVLLMVNEAFRCLGEGRVQTADELDLAMMLTDWAPHRGGPIRFARDEGMANIVERLRALAVHGVRYEPCERLLKEAAS